MNEKPILFSAPMVRAILEGRKTMTRRIVRHPPSTGAFVLMEMSDGSLWPFKSIDGESTDDGAGNETIMNCPHGIPGDRLWVRETVKAFQMPMEAAKGGFNGIITSHVVYLADNSESKCQIGQKWPTHPVEYGLPARGVTVPSIFMPRWASRITLEITDVRVERLQEITEEDAICEGVESFIYEKTYRYAFSQLWDSLNKKRGYGWDANPYVWVISFKRIAAS